MLRPVLVVTGTVAGLIALFTYKTHVPGVTPVAEPSSPAALTNSAAPTTGASGPASASATATGAKKPKPTASATRSTAPAMTPTTPVTTQASKAPSTAPTSAKATTAPKTTAPKPTPTPTKTTAPAGPQQFQGPTVNTQYGDVQVVITVSGGKITAANDVIQPADGIGANAIPQLNQEVLTAQSANIQTVSGATFTSQGYISSLQAAVNQAGL